MIFKDKNGFTLIEVMSALAVLAIALVILLGLRNRDLALSEESAYITYATLLARQKMSELTLLSDQEREKVALDGDFGEAYPNYTWAIEIYETPFAALREYVLRVSWKNKRLEENVQFVKYFFVKV